MSLILRFIKSLIYLSGTLLFLSSCSSIPSYLISQQHFIKLKVTFVGWEFISVSDVEGISPTASTQLKLTPIKDIG